MTAVNAHLAWTREFVGVPWLDKGRSMAGADCWGFAAVTYEARAGVVLPSYTEDYASADEAAEIAAIVAREKRSPRWLTVAGDPQELDILWFREGRFDAHAGIWIAPDTMLHMALEDCSKIERYDRPPWLGRLTGVYRWHAMQAPA